MKICPDCNNINDDNMMFCSICGGPLKDADTCKNVIICKNCQKNNNADDKCAFCGLQLHEGRLLEGKTQAGISRTIIVASIVVAVIIAGTILYILRLNRSDRAVTIDMESRLTLSDKNVPQTERLSQMLKEELEGYITVKEWLEAASDEIKQYELTDNEDKRLNDLIQRVSSLDYNDYEEQLILLENAKSLKEEVLNNRPLLESVDTDSMTSALSKQESVKDEVIPAYSIEPAWDLSNYPVITLNIRIKDANYGQNTYFSNLKGVVTWHTLAGAHWSYTDFREENFDHAWYFTFLSDQKENADELLEEWKMDIHLESENYQP